LQLYRDRAAFAARGSILRTKFSAPRTFRVNGFIASLSLLVANVDWYGVHGILPDAARAVLLWFVVVSILLSLMVTCYYSVVATLAYLPYVSCAVL